MNEETEEGGAPSQKRTLNYENNDQQREGSVAIKGVQQES